MCLKRVFTKKERDKVLKDLPNEFTVWKVVCKKSPGKYTTDCKFVPLHAGEMKFKQNIINPRSFTYSWGFPKYRGGGHFWLKKSAALDWIDSFCNEPERIVPCRVKKEWIVNMGKQSGNIVLVVKKAIFPKYIGGAKH